MLRHVRYVMIVETKTLTPPSSSISIGQMPRVFLPYEYK